MERSKLSSVDEIGGGKKEETVPFNVEGGELYDFSIGL